MLLGNRLAADCYEIYVSVLAGLALMAVICSARNYTCFFALVAFFGSSIDFMELIVVASPRLSAITCAISAALYFYFLISLI